MNNGSRVPESPETPPRRTPRVTLATRVALAVGVVVVVFAAVLVVELAAGRSARPGAELRAAPVPLLPARLDGYRIRSEPRLAASLKEGFDRASIGVTEVDAATVPLGASGATISAARLSDHAKTSSTQFRAGILSGAAAGFGIDAASHAFRYSIASEVAVFIADAPEGRLYVWFFRDAFVELFVPGSVVAEAGEVQRTILAAQLAPASPAASTARVG